MCCAPWGRRARPPEAWNSPPSRRQTLIVTQSNQEILFGPAMQLHCAYRRREDGEIIQLSGKPLKQFPSNRSIYARGKILVVMLWYDVGSRLTKILPCPLDKVRNTHPVTTLQPDPRSHGPDLVKNFVGILLENFFDNYIFLFNISKHSIGHILRMISPINRE